MVCTYMYLFKLSMPLSTLEAVRETCTGVGAGRGGGGGGGKLQRTKK